MKMRNNVQLSTDPWGIPSGTDRFLEMELFILVAIVLSCRKDLIQLYIVQATLDSKLLHFE